ncbi:hypothetical protein ABZ508_26490 [Streptomyces lavendulocolor]|uniref:Uncharacterized protein n=1 Tax=Streptomyces lavendulocolor TaxID=67316 RepID=A0ABV2WC65_9ACTN
MGLDFTHTDAHWSYTGFGRFRQALALHEGFELKTMVGYGGDREWSTVDTPLKPLLDHSDCDGELTPEDCATVAPRLREVVDFLWPADTSTWQLNPEACINRQNGLLLADGMDNAAQSGEHLEFC